MAISDAKATFGLSATATGDRPWSIVSGTVGQGSANMALTGCDIAFAGSIYLQSMGDEGEVSSVFAATNTTNAANAASLTTALTGANNDIIWTAATAGAAGNDITIEYVISVIWGVTVAVEGSAITITAAAGSLASAVRTAVAADTDANALVSSANAASNDGTGAIIAMAATALTGGMQATGWTGASVDFQGEAFEAAASGHGLLVSCTTGYVTVESSDEAIKFPLGPGAKAQIASAAALESLNGGFTITASVADSTAYIAIIGKT